MIANTSRHIYATQSFDYNRIFTGEFQRCYWEILKRACKQPHPLLYPGTKTSCAPGGYMSALGDFDLQLPIASSKGGSAEQISTTAVASCSSYQNPDWFYWNTASSYIVIKVPSTSTPCAKTSGKRALPHRAPRGRVVEPESLRDEHDDGQAQGRAGR